MGSSGRYLFRILSDKLPILKEVISDSPWFFHTKAETLKIWYSSISLTLPFSVLHGYIITSILMLHYLTSVFNTVLLSKSSKGKVVLVLNSLTTTAWRRMGSGCIDPRSLDLGTSWRWAISFTPVERATGTNWIGGWVDPRAGLDDTEKWKIVTPTGLKLRPFASPARTFVSFYLTSLLCLTTTVVGRSIKIRKAMFGYSAGRTYGLESTLSNANHTTYLFMKEYLIRN
jgi:hypothetical protein